MSLFKKITLGILFINLIAKVNIAEAAIFIDDIYTTDKHHFELELSYDYVKNIGNYYNIEIGEYFEGASRETDISVYLSYGVLDNWDIGFTIPYVFVYEKPNPRIDGLSDVALETKYRFFDEGDFFPGLALYVDMKLDSANEDRGLSSGEKDYSINTILTKTFGDNVVDFNLGYIFIGGKEKNILFYCLDFARSLTEKIGFCLEIYGETIAKGNFDQNVFITAVNLDYQLSKNLSFESGIGFGISRASPDYQINSKLTFTF